MASVLFTIDGAVMNFSSVSLQILMKGMQNTWFDTWKVSEGQRRTEWRLNETTQFYNRLRDINEPRTYINNVDEAMPEYYRVLAKTNKTFTAWASVIRFLPSIRRSEKWWTIIVTVGTGLITYAFLYTTY